MKAITSKFKDVFVILPEEQWNKYSGGKIRSHIDLRCGFKKWNPLSGYEGELYIEHEHMLCGMYYQKKGNQYKQLVRCVHGSVWTGIVDMRPESETFLFSDIFFLSAENGKSLYVPQGFAVGHLSGQDRTVIEVKMDRRFEPEKNQCLDPFDLFYQIPWPTERTVISVVEKKP